MAGAEAAQTAERYTTPPWGCRGTGPKRRKMGARNITPGPPRLAWAHAVSSIGSICSECEAGRSQFIARALSAMNNGPGEYRRRNGRMATDSGGQSVTAELFLFGERDDTPARPIGPVELIRGRRSSPFKDTVH